MIDLMRHVQSWLRKWSEKKASPSIKKHPRDKTSKYIKKKRIDSDFHHKRKNTPKQNKESK